MKFKGNVNVNSNGSQNLQTDTTKAGGTNKSSQENTVSSAAVNTVNQT